MIIQQPSLEEIAQNIAESVRAGDDICVAHTEHCDSLGIDPASADGHTILALAETCLADH